MSCLFNIIKHIWVTTVVILLCSGCGIFNRPHVDKSGYYTNHYNSCGPKALVEALTEYMVYNDLDYDIPTKRQISRIIQDNSSMLDGRKCLTFISKDAVEITWPHEMKEIVALFGLQMDRLDSIDELKKNDVGIILIHRRGTFDYHWICWPSYSKDTIMNYYGTSSTSINTVYILKRINRTDHSHLK